MDYDENKIDEVVLALMYLTLHDEVRAWKGFDFKSAGPLARERIYPRSQEQGKVGCSY
jgi:hypothetical protein